MEAALASGMDQEQLLTALQVIRKGVLRFWKRSVAVSFYRWWKKELKAAHKEERAPSMRSLVGGSKALAHAADASWWDWDRGSAPIFLRWPREYQLEIRDGLRPRFIAPPSIHDDAPAASARSKCGRQKRAKLDKFRRRESVPPTRGADLVSDEHLSVAKGEDIRMVFDTSKSKLNEVLFAPWFNLATPDAMARTVDVGYFGADNDYGEMFYNFWLHEDLRPYCGIDMTHQYPEEARLQPNSVLWNVLTRPTLGLRPSPYQSVQGALRADHVGGPHQAGKRIPLGVCGAKPARGS